MDASSVDFMRHLLDDSNRKHERMSSLQSRVVALEVEKRNFETELARHDAMHAILLADKTRLEALLADKESSADANELEIRLREASWKEKEDKLQNRIAELSRANEQLAADVDAARREARELVAAKDSEFALARRALDKALSDEREISAGALATQEVRLEEEFERQLMLRDAESETLLAEELAVQRDRLEEEFRRQLMLRDAMHEAREAELAQMMERKDDELGLARETLDKALVEEREKFAKTLAEEREKFAKTLAEERERFEKEKAEEYDNSFKVLLEECRRRDEWWLNSEYESRVITELRRSSAEGMAKVQAMYNRELEKERENSARALEEGKARFYRLFEKQNEQWSAKLIQKVEEAVEEEKQRSDYALEMQREAMVKALEEERMRNASALSAIRSQQQAELLDSARAVADWCRRAGGSLGRSLDEQMPGSEDRGAEGRGHPSGANGLSLERLLNGQMVNPDDSGAEGREHQGDADDLLGRSLGELMVNVTDERVGWRDLCADALSLANSFKQLLSAKDADLRRATERCKAYGEQLAWLRRSDAKQRRFCFLYSSPSIIDLDAFGSRGNILWVEAGVYSEAAGIRYCAVNMNSRYGRRRAALRKVIDEYNARVAPALRVEPLGFFLMDEPNPIGAKVEIDRLGGARGGGSYILRVYGGAQGAAAAADVDAPVLPSPPPL